MAGILLLGLSLIVSMSNDETAAGAVVTVVEGVGRGQYNISCDAGSYCPGVLLVLLL